MRVHAASEFLGIVRRESPRLFRRLTCLRTGPEDAEAFHVARHFRYTVAGQEYERELLYPTIVVAGFASHDAAAADLARFPLHLKVHPRVDRLHSDDAFLSGSAATTPSVLVALGLPLPPLA